MRRVVTKSEARIAALEAPPDDSQGAYDSGLRMGRRYRAFCAAGFLQLGFDLLMQVFGEFPVRQSIDHFVEKAACDEALSSEVINAAALKIKQLFRFHLPGSCPVCTTHIIRQNLKTGHRIRLSFVTQQ